MSICGRGVEDMKTTEEAKRWKDFGQEDMKGGELRVFFKALGKVSWTETLERWENWVYVGAANPWQIQLWRISDCWRFGWPYHGREREDARGWVHLSRLILTDAHYCSLRRKPLFSKPQTVVLPPRNKLGSLKVESFKTKVLRSQTFLAHETLFFALEH